MTQYQVKTPDGVVHRIEAVTHVNDSLGLTLYATAGGTAAIFPRFEWMRLVPAVVDQPADSSSTTSASETTNSGEVVAPAATGE